MSKIQAYGLRLYSERYGGAVYTGLGEDDEGEWYLADHVDAEIARLRLALKKINGIASGDREVIAKISAEALADPAGIDVYSGAVDSSSPDPLTSEAHKPLKLEKVNADINDERGNQRRMFNMNAARSETYAAQTDARLAVLEKDIEALKKADLRRCA